MRKMLVITRDGGRTGQVGLPRGQDHTMTPAPEGTRPGQDRPGDIDTLFVDAESLLGDNDSVGDALKALWAHYPAAAIVVMTDEAHTPVALDAVRAGAFDYLTHPVGREELGLAMDRVHQSDVMQSELDYLRGQFWNEEALEFVDTRSRTMREVFAKVRQVAATRTTVLLTGETGTGKSLMAKLIHAHSNRNDKPFISVHCGAIPDTLVESELFGHEKGAFTGAVRRKLGKFELAGGGTLFLDEIGTISQSAQVKLLNAIQERVIQRVGGEADIPVDVRIIAATNDDMGTLCDDGLFRRDLFYRLNVFPVCLPPLRERSEDILRLSESFIKQLNNLLNKDIRGIHPDVLDAFRDYPWPGNVRELENVIERACILETGPILLPSSFPPDFFSPPGTIVTAPVRTGLPLREARQITVEGFEKQYLSAVLEECGGRIADAARRAGITTRQLNKLMNRHGLTRRQFRPAR
ncbi:sigma-54-dependent transcriptional regulator [Pseudodesulfovibrio pelocollis]|uniref:sigma-54-dependent transcriptional regulator n=1 Tax=Pseudodesulfovibrio pelocollis TaxID=3051432 RepID=UPI00255A8C0C|nr:sigma-54 dependent transcriptional regulator [Pseudodesulfovibrio sp. SB368]